MHMWHHVTNHLIISNDKDSNSENRIKLRVRDIRGEGVGAHPMTTDGVDDEGVEASDAEGNAELLQMLPGWTGARPPCSCSSLRAEINGWELSGSSGPRGP
jgi:hypothetical protein